VGRAAAGPAAARGHLRLAGDLAGRLGLDNIYGDHRERYPHVELASLLASQPDVVVLPDEPYPFSAADGPDAFPGLRCALVPGRDLTWYGPSLVGARQRLAETLRG